jgi:hypothetical protein
VPSAPLDAGAVTHGFGNRINQQSAVPTDHRAASVGRIRQTVRGMVAEVLGPVCCSCHVGTLPANGYSVKPLGGSASAYDLLPLDLAGIAVHVDTISMETGLMLD